MCTWIKLWGDEVIQTQNKIMGDEVVQTANNKIKDDNSYYQSIPKTKEGVTKWLLKI